MRFCCCIGSLLFTKAVNHSFATFFKTHVAQSCFEIALPSPSTKNFPRYLDHWFSRFFRGPAGFRASSCSCEDFKCPRHRVRCIGGTRDGPSLRNHTHITHWRDQGSRMRDRCGRALTRLRRSNPRHIVEEFRCHLDVFHHLRGVIEQKGEARFSSRISVRLCELPTAEAVGFQFLQARWTLSTTLSPTLSLTLSYNLFLSWSPTLSPTFVSDFVSKFVFHLVSSFVSQLVSRFVSDFVPHCVSHFVLHFVAYFASQLVPLCLSLCHFASCLWLCLPLCCPLCPQLYVLFCLHSEGQNVTQTCMNAFQPWIWTFHCCWVAKLGAWC